MTPNPDRQTPRHAAAGPAAATSLTVLAHGPVTRLEDDSSTGRPRGGDGFAVRGAPWPAPISPSPVAGAAPDSPITATTAQPDREVHAR